MKVLMQTDNDCLTACLATVFNLPYEDCPRFWPDGNDAEPYPDHDKRYVDFLHTKGLYPVTIQFNPAILEIIQGFCIVTVESNSEANRISGVGHAVVYKDGKPYFDPDTGDVPLDRKPTHIDLFVAIMSEALQAANGNESNH